MNLPRRLWWPCILLAAMTSGQPARGASASVLSFDNRDRIADWQFANGPEFPGASGAVRWSGEEGHARPGCLVLAYDFSGGGNYVQAMTSVPAGREFKSVRVWLKKPGAHRITFRAVDSTDQTFQKSTAYDCPDWQQIEVDLGAWANSFGGAGDNRPHPPFKRFAILVENSTSDKEGALLIDDVEFLEQAAPGPAPVTYTALEAVPNRPGQWRDWSGETLASGTRRERGFLNDFSLLGDPQSMRVHVKGSGGAAVSVGLGSHFQNFRKQATVTAEGGSQFVEVRLGRLDGWEHSDGQNDGVARLPLRLRSIAPLDGGAALEVGKVEVVTLPRDGQRIVLVPDARTEAGAIRFSVKVMNLGPQAVQGKLLCDIRHLGGSLARHEVEMQLGQDRKAGSWSVSQPMGDHAFIEAVFQWSDSEFTSKPVSIGTCRPPADRGSAELAPDSFMGAGLYLYRYRWAYGADYREFDGGRARIARVCEWAQRAGVKWTREEIQWATTEPKEGEFDWRFYDDVVSIAHEHGISVYGLLCYWSGWAAKDTPEGVEQYCRWVRQVVRHYKDRIKHWEIWNEPNIFFWSGPRELYAQMLTKAYAAIKEEDPEAVVMGCSTAGIDTEFIRKVIGWGGRFDALTIHPYRGQMDDLGFIRELQDVHRLVDGREVWLTEIGFPSQLIDGWSERRQASLCARAYLCTAASGAGRNISWYDFRNDGNDSFYNEMNFGLMRNDLRPKPGYGTLATLGRLLGGMRLKEQIDVGADAYAFRFTDGTRDIVAACAPDRGRLLSYRAGSGWTVTGAFGETIEPAIDGNAATITLDAGFPVYLAWPKNASFEAIDPPVSCVAESASVRAGDSLRFRIRADRAAENVGWDLPHGWPSPVKEGENLWRIVVPRDAPAYEFDIQAIVRDGTGPLRLPVRVQVMPMLIRI